MGVIVPPGPHKFEVVFSFNSRPWWFPKVLWDWVLKRAISGLEVRFEPATGVQETNESKIPPTGLN